VTTNAVSKIIQIPTSAAVEAFFARMARYPSSTVGLSVLLIATSTPTGFSYLAATLITDLANWVNFLSVSDSSVKVV
jgi:hypothetical protein